MAGSHFLLVVGEQVLPGALAGGVDAHVLRLGVLEQARGGPLPGLLHMCSTACCSSGLALLLLLLVLLMPVMFSGGRRKDWRRERQSG